MAWSTRELADLAGTTVNTVRHYHRLGLLTEPDRRYNGYKQYRTEHLVALLRIRRLVDLREIVAHDDDPVTAEIDRLPADADEQTRRDLAERLAPSLAQNLRDYPWLLDPADRLTRGEQATRETVVDAMREVYNPAQLEVLARASLLAHRLAAED